VTAVSNVANLDAVESLAARTIGELGRVDIVVNNAGAAKGDDRKPVIDLDPGLWRTVLDVNLTGSFLMSKVFGRLIVDGGEGGSIVNISSIAGKALAPSTAAYAASKAGLQALTACMAGEVGAAGVRVNAICPGIIDTSRMDDLGRGELWDEMVRTRVPLGRAGTGDDIAHIVVYLCSDQGAWVTGQSWNVDGGTIVQH
jgi:3-oxoacyl-[acyl-carrier protein] reductase